MGDPFSAIASLIVGWHRTGKMAQALLRLHHWAVLLVGMGISFWLSSATVCGAALMAGKGWAFSVGAGLVTGAAMAFLAFTRSPLARELVVAVPQKTVEAQFGEDGRGPTVSSPPPEK